MLSWGKHFATKKNKDSKVHGAELVCVPTVPLSGKKKVVDEASEMLKKSAVLLAKQTGVFVILGNVIEKEATIWIIEPKGNTILEYKAGKKLKVKDMTARTAQTKFGGKAELLFGHSFMNSVHFS